MTSPPRELLIASDNPGKLREIETMLAGRGFRLRTQRELGILPLPEDGETFVANAMIKARHAAASAGLPAIGDDSGIEVDALGGRPGIYSARYSGPAADAAANRRKLLAELDGVPEPRRGATFVCAMVFVRSGDDPQPIVAEARWTGRIGLAERGRGGFGYDSLFVLPDGRTAAELPDEEKNRLSHRGQALAALAARMRAAGW